MDRMVVVVFENETKAYQGKSTLQQLEYEGNITLYASAVVLKHADGSVTVKNEDYAAPLASIAGTAFGTLIGVLGGPVGIGIGAASGLLVGGMIDVDNLRVGEDYVEDVSRALTPNKVALIAQIDEEWTTPLDSRMEIIGGTVFRRALWAVQEQVDDEAIAAMKADLAGLKAEISKVNADRKKKLQAKIDALEAKIQARENKLKESIKAQKAEAQAKSEVLKKNAAAAGRALKTLANTPV